MNTPRITQPKMIQLRLLGLLTTGRCNATYICCSSSVVHKSPFRDYRQFIENFSLHQDRISILIEAQRCVRAGDTSTKIVLNVFFKKVEHTCLMWDIIIINNKSFISSQWTYTYIHTYFKSLRYNRKASQQQEGLFIHHYTSSGKIIQNKYCNCWQKYNTWSNNDNEILNLVHTQKTSAHSSVHNQFAKLSHTLEYQKHQ